MKTTKKIFALLPAIACTALLTSGSAIAGDAAAGKTKAAVCAACHGTTGKAIAPMYPNINGQNEPYLVSSLKAYRDGQRSGGMSAVMVPMSKNLTDTDIADLAAYFASQE